MTISSFTKTWGVILLSNVCILVNSNFLTNKRTRKPNAFVHSDAIARQISRTKHFSSSTNLTDAVLLEESITWGSRETIYNQKDSKIGDVLSNEEEMDFVKRIGMNLNDSRALYDEFLHVHMMGVILLDIVQRKGWISYCCFKYMYMYTYIYILRIRMDQVAHEGGSERKEEKNYFHWNHFDSHYCRKKYSYETEYKIKLVGTRQ